MTGLERWVTMTQYNGKRFAIRLENILAIAELEPGTEVTLTNGNTITLKEPFDEFKDIVFRKKQL